MSLSTFKTIMLALLACLAGLSFAAVCLGLYNTGAFGLFALVFLYAVYKYVLKTSF